jgi:hypothetical protein
MLGTSALLGFLLVTTVRPHPPAVVALLLDRAHSSARLHPAFRADIPHTRALHLQPCRSARSKRAVICRQRHTPVQSLLPSCRRPNSSRCAGAMGHWLCAFFPRDVCAVCVCGCALRCSESFGGLSLHTGRVAHAARSRLGGFGPRPHARAFCSRGPPTAPRVWGEDLCLGRRVCVVCPERESSSANAVCLCVAG